MIQIFHEFHKAVSNVFVRTLENDDYTYPAPIKFILATGDEEKNTKNILEVKFTSYNDSFLPLNNHFSILIYLLSYEYKVKTLYVGGLVREDVHAEMGGYRGIYKYSTDLVSMNIGLEEVYDKYVKVRDNEIEFETISH